VRLDPPSRSRPLDLHGLDRLIALLGLAVFGAALLTVISPAKAVPSVAAVSAPPATPAPAQVRVTHKRMAIRTERAAVHATPQHATTALVAAPRRTATAARRHTAYVPHGTGMWIYEWHHTRGGSASKMVARATHVGLSTLYLRTDSSWDGFTAQRTLPALLRATRGSTVNVVAWDFPRLRHPVRDAGRLAHAARVGRAGNGPQVAAVAPDIETPSEGTFNAAWRVRLYLHVLNKRLPEGVTILSTVPWPSSYRRADYPYRTVAAHSDVLVPMAYWYNKPPGLVTSRSIHYLRQFHKPVAPVGQGYDGKLDVPSLRHNHLAREVPVFLRTAARAGAPAVSIWSWQSARPATWNALARARHLFTHK
jgi:hypothetical protein